MNSPEIRPTPLLPKRGEGGFPKFIVNPRTISFITRCEKIFRRHEEERFGDEAIGFIFRFLWTGDSCYTAVVS